MLFNLKDYKNELLFVPLGGANEIGVNVNLYHYEGKWLMVDCGSGFATDYLPGVDMIIADMSFIESHKKDLLGLVLTHAHEDHIGAVQYIWNTLQCPIYATKFTANFLRTRLQEFNLVNKYKIIEIAQKSKIDLKPFIIELVSLTHSAPEMQALMIKTKVGNVLHTGDWKFDNDPIIGTKSDEDLLKSYGDEGVLALVCDSTNVFNPGISGSEGDLRKSLVDIISGCTNLVVVTTFASNLARLDTIIHAAICAGRKIAICGRSLHRMLNAAQASGYLNDVSLIDERSIGKFKRGEVLVIATGCQGEPLAATSKIANNDHPTVKLLPKDTVIFSSKIIPGNDKKIYRLFNSFAKAGVEVITERDHFVHVSGHPSVDELKKMYSLVRPRICVPVHGEPIHIHEHVKLAKANGIQHAIEVENGSVVLLNTYGPKVIHKVITGYFAVDGNYLLPADSSVFRMRRRMKESGIVIISIIVDSTRRLTAEPILSTPGLLDPEEDVELIEMIKNEITEVFEIQHKNTKGRLTNDQIENAVRSNVKKILKSEINKLPIIIVNIENIFEK